MGQSRSRSIARRRGLLSRFDGGVADNRTVRAGETRAAETAPALRMPPGIHATADNRIGKVGPTIGSIDGEEERARDGNQTQDGQLVQLFEVPCILQGTSNSCNS